MSTTLKNIILLIVLVVLSFVGYYYFFAKKPTTDVASATGKYPISQSASSAGADSSAEADEGVIANEAYLKQLITLRDINFSRELFNDDAYKILQVSNVDIAPEPKGRVNPFAPLDQQYGGEAIATSSYKNLVPSTKKVKR